MTLTLTAEIADTHATIATLELAIQRLDRLLRTCRNKRRAARLVELRRWYVGDIETLRERLASLRPFTLADGCY